MCKAFWVLVVGSFYTSVDARAKPASTPSPKKPHISRVRVSQRHTPPAYRIRILNTGQRNTEEDEDMTRVVYPGHAENPLSPLLPADHPAAQVTDPDSPVMYPDAPHRPSQYPSRSLGRLAPRFLFPE